MARGGLLSATIKIAKALERASKQARKEAERKERLAEQAERNRVRDEMRLKQEEQRAIQAAIRETQRKLNNNTRLERQQTARMKERLYESIKNSKVMFEERQKNRSELIKTFIRKVIK